MRRSVKSPGNIGSERRMHYAVVGGPVNVAARLQVAAGPGQILVDAATHESVSHLVWSQDLGSLRLAGKGDWVPAFNILGLREADPVTSPDGAPRADGSS